MHEDWLGLAVADPSGRPYGRLDELFVGRSSGAPEFGIVTVGEADAGDERVAIPLLGAQRRNDVLVLPLDPEHVLSAPRVQGEVEEIPADAGRMILRHFGMEAEETAEMRAVHGDPVAVPPEELPEAGAPVTGEEAADVVVSEEQLAVETRSVPTERVRVRKAVVTEDVTVTVTLRREELVIDREPIAPGSDVAADATAMTGEGALEFVLHAEEPVVTKRVVPVERVRLHRNTITEEHRVTDTVRKEQVAVDEEPITREEPTR